MSSLPEGALGFLLPEDRDESRVENWLCCAGAAMSGVDNCTCWGEAYDVVHDPILEGPPATRSAMCHDCAFRKDSPERQRGEDPADLDNFWCHQGVRRIVAWVHPDGRRRVEPFSGAYDPVTRLGLIFRADGSPGERCAGWARANRWRKGADVISADRQGAAT